MVEERERTSTGSRSAPRRGWVSLYTVAFALLFGAVLTLASSSLGSLRSFSLLWTSIALSGAAIVVSVVAVLLPRRR